MQPDIQKATPEGIAKAACAIKEGRVAAFPTETVYGLGADATNANAVASVFETKGRPWFNPLIAHVPSLEAANRLVELPPALQRLVTQLWPGPLTVVAPQRLSNGICDLATAGLPTLAVRVPANQTARALLEAVGRPIVAPSANTSGRPSPTQAAHVAADFADHDLLILDDGPCALGLESTIIGLDSDDTLTLLRPGAIPSARVEQIANQPLNRIGPISQNAPTAPGQLTSHYAPHAHLRLNATDLHPGEAVIEFGPPTRDGGVSEGAIIMNLSPTGDLREAAANLFKALRTIDQSGHAKVAVVPIPNEGLGEAINDRLARAAAPRSN
ncbi:MAG: L-threonylcarbamoyladenylate synthase [Pseudomonadota bacterium]